MIGITAHIGIAFAFLFGGAPVFLAADEIALSDDGVTWSDTRAEVLFDLPDRWVPGDDETRSFWARNTSGDTGSLAVQAIGLDDSLFAQGEASVRIRAGAGAWELLDADYTTLRDTLDAGEAREYYINVRFAAESGNDTMNRTFPLSFHLQLSMAGGGEEIPPDAHPLPGVVGPNADGLATSGSWGGTPVLVASGLAVIIGAVTLIWARHRKSGGGV